MRNHLSQHATRNLSVLLWGLCLGLGCSLAWNLLSNLGTERDDRSKIADFQRQARRDLARVRSGLNRVRLRNTGRTHLQQMAQASMQLRPLRPRAVEPPSNERAIASESKKAPGAGGPLAEDWEYAGGVFIADDPSRSRVWLRKKEDSKTLRARSSSRSRYRGRSTRSTRSRGRRTTYRRDRRNEIISFYASEDSFEDEELEVEFLIRSVNWNEIVYSSPEEPDEEYVLERVDNSPYSFLEERRLEPFADVEEPEDETEKGHFRIRAPGYVDRVEEDYQRLLRDELPEPEVEL